MIYHMSVRPMRTMDMMDLLEMYATLARKVCGSDVISYQGPR